MGAVCGGNQKEATNYQKINISNDIDHTNSDQQSHISSQKSNYQIVSTTNESPKTHRESINHGGNTPYSSTMDIQQGLFGFNNAPFIEISKSTEGSNVTEKIPPLPEKYKIKSDNVNPLETTDNHTNDMERTGDGSLHPPSSPSIETILKHETNSTTVSNAFTPIFSKISKEIIAIYDRNRMKQDQRQPIPTINKKIIKTLNRWFVYI